MKELQTEVLWFHVDDLSSPHAYLRLNEGETVPPPNLIQVCSQIVKNGSIEGVKRPSVDVIYTSCSNLTKSKSFKVGTVTFKPGAKVSTVHGVRKDNQILKTLEKAKDHTDVLSMERELDDIIKNKQKSNKKNSQQKSFDDWGDEDDWDEPASKPEKKTGNFMDNVPKAEFSTNLEDDFM
ncbi:coiled-coil domain-containing protein [Histomonas meleagridis]|uniref:coiled-coil domain-containing protein 25 n=1 Tax=Histomonas meleagridis TaxID=135588 RepID=UPI00355A8053|nr:coiled-coil domain-containing protein [Histomonas meleagridis]KAH0806176.1 coiled-coil domain-containing protein 25 [Histomonas meleagridis]